MKYRTERWQCDARYPDGHTSRRAFEVEIISGFNPENLDEEFVARTRAGMRGMVEATGYVSPEWTVQDLGTALGILLIPQEEIKR